MNNSKITTLFFFLLLASSQPGRAQGGYFYQPRIFLGGDVAYFRISLDNFERVYVNRWGESMGGFVGVRAFGGNHVIFKYHTFEQQGRNEGRHPQSDLALKDAHWHEEMYLIGLRLHPPITRKFHSYYGFGVAFLKVIEKENLSVFNSTAQSDDLGSGFYLDLGLEYFPWERVAAFFEMEISSGGIRGKTGFESMSVGGFRFALGVCFWPF